MNAWMRRLVDVTCAALLLLLLSPVLLGAGLAVLLADGRPILFRQERVGRHGTRFRIAKFRSMRPSGAGVLITAAGDARVTALGRVLRRTKVDELPQLWNVLVGEMAMVGPRPEVPLFVDRNPRLFRGIAGLRPGVTDWSSLAFRDEEQLLARNTAVPEYYERVLLPRKVALARLYGRQASMPLDLRLIVATALTATRSAALVEWVAGRQVMSRARAGL